MAQIRATIDCWSFAVCFLNDCFFSLEKIDVFPQGACYQWKTFFWGVGGKESLVN